MDVKDIIRPAETEATPSGARSARHKPGPAERARLAAQKRGEVAPVRTPTPGGAKRPTQLETRLAGELGKINLIFAGVCAMVHKGGGPLDPTVDPLQPNEVMALSRDLAAQAVGHKRFAKILESAITVTGSLGLIGTVGGIIMVRASMHGAIPEQFALVGAAINDPSFDMSALVGAEEPEG
jgi:hypothetical protein